MLSATTAALPALSVGLGGVGLASVVAGQGFGPKMQYGGGGCLDLLIPLTDWLSLETSIDYTSLAPSDTSGGFLYRGYAGAALAVMAQAGGTIASSPRLGVLRLSGGLGIAGALPTYWYTTLSFFYLEPRLAALLDWQPAGLPQFDFQLSIPLRAQLRRDLDYSLSVGVGLTAYYRLKAPR